MKLIYNHLLLFTSKIDIVWMSNKVSLIWYAVKLCCFFNIIWRNGDVYRKTGIYKYRQDNVE